MENTIQVIVTNTNNQLTTTSNNIADVFGKQHRDVLKAIDNILAELPEHHQRNFAQTVNYRENPSGGEPIASRNFTITRDGFTLLAMGFTGKKALEFKLAYIDQFNAMEKALAQPQIERKTLTPEQQRFVQKAVNAKVKKTGEHWNTIYHNIKDVFNVGTYTDIKQETFPALCEYLGVVYEGELILAGTPKPVRLEEPTVTPQPTELPELSQNAQAIERMICNLVPNQVKEIFDTLVKMNHNNMQILAMFTNQKMVNI
jgi:Rha family phage regulatory protein